MPTADAQPGDAPKQPRRPARWLLRSALVLTITPWGLLLLAWLTLHWLILPHIEQWRLPIELRASRALGVPVQIGEIVVHSSGWFPSLELRDVALLDRDRHPALLLPKVYAALSPRSLLSLKLRFEQLLIDGAQLEVRRDRNGRHLVAGLDFNGGDSGDDNVAADWFFAQHEFVIRGGSLRWKDDQRQAPELTLTHVQMVIRNSLRRHDIAIEADPPPDWGDRFRLAGQFTQPLLARDGDWRRWSGDAFVNLPRADVHALGQHITLPFDLSEGVGALRGWFDVKSGQPVSATVDVALRAVAMRLAADVDPLEVQELEGRLVAKREGGRFALNLQHFTFLTGDDIRWPQGDMSLTWEQGPTQVTQSGTFSAQQLDVGLMAQIASRIPLGSAVRKLLADLNPKGNVGGLSASWDGPLDAPAHYHARGLVSALSLSPGAASAPSSPGRPGLQGATAQFEADEKHGQALIEIHGGAVDLPGVFEDPHLVLDQLSANVQWSLGAPKPAGTLPQVVVQVKQARFSNVDASGEISAQWTSGTGVGMGRDGRYPGHLELDSKLVNGNAAHTYRYLPLALSDETRRYVQDAIQSGTVVEASFHVNGDLWDFPYFGKSRSPTNGPAGGAKPGQFSIAAKLENVGLAFVPTSPARPDRPAFESPWPALSNVNVELALGRGVLELRNGHAKLGDVDWGQVQATIRDLGGDATLSLASVARGPLNEMMRTVNSSPVGAWTGKVFEAGVASGNAELQLALQLPLAHLADASVKGSIALLGNALRFRPDTPEFSDAKGRIEFSNKGFAVLDTTAKLYGAETSISGGTQPDGAIRLAAQGQVTAEGLRRANEFGPLARIATEMKGQTSYRADLGFERGGTEFSVASNLVGMGLELPPPLHKPADESLPMRFQLTVEPAPQAAARPIRDHLRLELGNVLQVQYLRDLTGDQPRVISGGIGVLAPAPEPATGVSASVKLKTLQVDEWQAAAARLAGPTDARETGAMSTYVPDAIGLQVQDLVAGPRKLTNVAAGLSQEGGVWRTNINADQLNGYIEFRPPAPGRFSAAAGRIYARLSRLSLPKSDADQVESLLDQPPLAIPALDIVVDDFELRGKKLGRVEIEAVNRRTGPGRDGSRDWQLSKFNVITPEAQLTATGNWSVGGSATGRTGPAAKRAVMDFKLVVSDSGALLDRLGTEKAIRGGKGQLSGQISWLGSPLELNYATLNGQIQIAIEAGQFLKVDPGAARLLGVLSLQSLPRRFTLDFRDLFQEGFAFDSITGDVHVAEGVAQTSNLRIRGVQALVLMDGSADIEHESQDLRVVVVPEINAGTAALAYAVINPAIGLGAFLAQALLNKPLAQAGTREFHVTGGWADPKVDRVEHAVSDTPPAGESVPAPVKSNP